MTYPIIAEKYIAAMRMEFGPSEAAEEAHRAVIPLVNASYQDGLEGKPGYPMDPMTELKNYEEHEGKPAIAPKLITAAINWCNEAYEAGRREAMV